MFGLVGFFCYTHENISLFDKVLKSTRIYLTYLFRIFFPGLYSKNLRKRSAVSVHHFPPAIRSYVAGKAPAPQCDWACNGLKLQEISRISPVTAAPICQRPDIGADSRKTTSPAALMTLRLVPHGRAGDMSLWARCRMSMRKVKWTKCNTKLGRNRRDHHNRERDGDKQELESGNPGSGPAEVYNKHEDRTQSRQDTRESKQHRRH